MSSTAEIFLLGASHPNIFIPLLLEDSFMKIFFSAFKPLHLYLQLTLTCFLFCSPFVLTKFSCSFFTLAIVGIDLPHASPHLHPQCLLIKVLSVSLSWSTVHLSGATNTYIFLLCARHGSGGLLYSTSSDSHYSYSDILRNKKALHMYLGVFQDTSIRALERGAFIFTCMHIKHLQEEGLKLVVIVHGKGNELLRDKTARTILFSTLCLNIANLFLTIWKGYLFKKIKYYLYFEG